MSCSGRIHQFPRNFLRWQAPGCIQVYSFKSMVLTQIKQAGCMNRCDCFNSQYFAVATNIHKKASGYTQWNSTLKNLSSCYNIKFTFYYVTSGGQNYCLYFYSVHFSTPQLIRHLWHLNTAVFLHRSLICPVLLISLFLLRCLWW